MTFLLMPSRLSRRAARRTAALALLPLAAALGGCATGPFANHFSGTAYRCDNGVAVRVKETEGRATLQTGRGTEVLLRDAGGVGPQQAVYSNPQVRLQTGMDPEARGAFLEGMVAGGKARCLRERSFTEWFQ
ncbi:hypothetical protein GT347_12395 [Xylophilus rhododendri]|uniref:Lipoprotein n=1 Tax=Xylophilus rhododendri TaxID=2697032 RepID=A0A857J449_9BURK|nr:hypothetical protein [Xylophilus rhododendri]QHI98720.1 hypothetical protein GT347_12395 [Xylophilus rhododendri]